MTKTEFLAWMTEWAKSTTGRNAIGLAVMGYSPGRQRNGQTGPAIPDPNAPAYDRNEPATYGPSVGTWNLGSALWLLMQRSAVEGREVPPTAQQNAAADAEDVGRLLTQTA